MIGNKVVARYWWDIDVVITVGDTYKTIYISTEPDYMTKKEIEQAAEHIATHGVWHHETLTPPHRIYDISVNKAEGRDVYQG